MSALTAHQEIALADAGVRDARRGVRSARVSVWSARLGLWRARFVRFAA